MYKCEFTEEEKEQIHYERFHHPHPRVQLKMEVLWLKSQGIPHQEITQLAGVSPNTLRTYLREFRKGGLEKVKEIRFHQPQSDLMDYKSSIESDFESNPPATLKQAMARIEKLTGIKRSIPQIQNFLKKIGMKRLKTGIVPEKANLEEQEEFVKKNRTSLGRSK